jgi:hypothetical protein
MRSDSYADSVEVGFEKDVHERLARVLITSLANKSFARKRRRRRNVAKASGARHDGSMPIWLAEGAAAIARTSCLRTGAEGGSGLAHEARAR